MRVAYICTDPGVPVFGSKGCSVHVQEMLRFLLSVGADVTLFSTRPGGPVPAGLESVAVRRLEGDLKGTGDREVRSIALNKTILSELAAGKLFDVIYERYSLFSYAGMEYGDRHSIPSILEVNAPLIEEQRRHREMLRIAYAHNTSRMAFEAASTIVAVSDQVRDYVHEITPAKDGVFVIPNGVDTDRFKPAERATLARRADSFTVGFVGSLKPWHGVEDLVRAFALVRESIDGSTLLIVGDGPERGNLESLAGALQLDDQVAFTGKVGHDQVPGLLRSMDVAVAPYPQTSGNYFSPLKIFEYMAAGVPVVATRSGQIPDIMKDRVTGLLVTPADPDALAAAIKTLHGDSPLASRMAAAARDHVVANHTWRSVGLRTLAAAGLSVSHLEAAA